MTTYLTAFLLSCAISLLLTPMIAALCRRFGIYDHPLDKRKIHTRSIPHLGGIAVYVAFFAPAAGLLLLHNNLAEELRANLWMFGMFAAAATLIHALGVYDDLKSANAWIKFPVQGIAAMLIYHAGMRIELLSVPFIGPVALDWLSLPLTVLWIVGVTNAINLIDGIDGLASGVGFFASSTIFLLCLAPGRQHLLTALFMASLAGGLLGFVRYNFSPATIFLGDSGSLLVGFVIASLSIQGSQKSSTTVALLIPVVVLGLPIFDTLVAMVRRYVRGESLFTADRQHVHHRLLDLGLSTPRAVLVLYGTCCLLGAIALSMVYGRNDHVGLTLILVSVMAYIGARKLGYLDMILSNIKSGQGLPPGLRAVYGKRLTGSIQQELHLADDVGDLWQKLCAVLDRLDFDRAEFLFYSAAADSQIAPLLWQREDPGRDVNRDVRLFWTAELVVQGSRGPIGELLIARDLDRANPLPSLTEWTGVLGKILAGEFDRLNGTQGQVRSA